MKDKRHIQLKNIVFLGRHFIKGIKNRIVKAGKSVNGRALMDWLPSIVNMLWWSLGTAKGN